MTYTRQGPAYPSQEMRQGLTCIPQVAFQGADDVTQVIHMVGQQPIEGLQAAPSATMHGVRDGGYASSAM